MQYLLEPSEFKFPIPLTLVIIPMTFYTLVGCRNSKNFRVRPVLFIGQYSYLPRMGYQY